MRKFTKAISLILALAIMLCALMSLTACNEDKDGKADDPAGENNTSKPSGYVRVDAAGNESATGSYIKFGTYPQSEVTDAGLKNTLTTMAGTLPANGSNGAWTSYKYYNSASNTTDYMWYQDISYSGEKYRGVYFTSYRPRFTDFTSNVSNSFQDENGYNPTNIYWFKYEPILWRILKEKDDKVFLLCEMLIDSQEFYDSTYQRTDADNSTIYANNYAHSNIRKWLNDSFYDTAFTNLEKQKIELTAVDNSPESTGDSSNSYFSENTNDYIFLPSAKDLMTEDYGFNKDQEVEDKAREKKTTAYAQCQGVFTESEDDYAGNGYWLLRSAGYYDSFYVRTVDVDGACFDSSAERTFVGVAPALWIRL